jgi:hypothetical protein
MKTLILLVCLLTNRTEHTIVELYCTPAFSSIPGVDLLDTEDGRVEVAGGATRRFSFEAPLNSPYWDVIAVDHTGGRYFFYGVPKDRLSVTLTEATRQAGEADENADGEFDDGFDDTFDPLFPLDTEDDF